MASSTRLLILAILVLQVVILANGFHNGTLFCDTSTSEDHTGSTSKAVATVEGKKVATTDEEEIDWWGVGVTPRAFPKWEGNFPCYEPEENWYATQIQRSPAHTGLLYMKEMKTGSSTLSGVTLRIAKQVALRTTTKFKICKARFDHSLAVELDYRNRIRDKSFLFTVIRKPTKRATSQFFHFQVSREKKEPSDVNFQKYLKHPLFNNYYFKSLSLQRSQMAIRKKPSKLGPANSAGSIVNQMLKDYDFIGITERMDESLVVLAMLLDLKLTDVLYLTAKGSGGFDDGRYNQTCVYIVPSYVSPSMKEYFESPAWIERTEGDELLYKAAIASLDMTIDALGRDAFDEKLADFRKARVLADEMCAHQVQYPCNADGSRRARAPGCLWNDSGCGNECLDKVTELIEKEEERMRRI